MTTQSLDDHASKENSASHTNPDAQETPLKTESSSPDRASAQTVHAQADAAPAPDWWQRYLRRLLWGGIFGMTAVASAALGASVALIMPLPERFTPRTNVAGLADLWESGFRYQVSRPVNILVMGVDENIGAAPSPNAVFEGRTDTLLLVRVDPQNGRVNILSIPRDSRVQIPDYGTDKINQANVEGGPELVAQTISHNFGNVPIDRYVRVSTGAFRELVDLVGGLELNVPKRMEYEDRTQDLFIDLYPGWQTLNGEQAEQFARFRGDERGDIGRVQRQQMLLKAMRDRLTQPTVIPKLPQAVQILQRYIDTNLSLEEMLALANFALDLQAEDLNMVMLPGSFSSAADYRASYWLPDWETGAQIMSNYFDANGIATLADNDAKPITRLRIAVQNASRESEVAVEVAQFLQEQGFYNVYVIEDWSQPMNQTEVIAQRGDVQSAEILQSVLNVGRTTVDSTGDLQSDITLRIGDDWVDQARQPDEPLN